MLTKKELDDLRPWVAEEVTTVLGHLNPSVVNQALDCVGKSFSRQSTTGSILINDHSNTFSPHDGSYILIKLFNIKNYNFLTISRLCNNIISTLRYSHNINFCFTCYI